MSIKIKYKNLFGCLFFSSALIFSLLGVFNYSNKDVDLLTASNVVVEPKLISLPTTLYLKHNSENEVRDYYKTLNNLPDSELKGYNLLKNLKPILKNNSTYVDYNTVWQTSCITERDWTRSSIETIPCDSLDKTEMIVKGYKDSYKYKGKGGDDPFLWVLYRNDNGKHNITINATHNPDPGVGGLNKEHVWCQSRGFKGSPATGPAGTDVHHLIVADALVNQASHNNISYGDVLNPSTNKPNIKYPVMGQYEGTIENYIVGNYRGTNDSVSGEVFEPLKEHKGDIARAIFYMAARYNNLANETNAISDFEPNLIINNNTMKKSAEKSSDTHAVNMSYLKFLYKWHLEDPVDDFEIYRNDLIYNNFQHNRNPFVDFPSWVDLIWNVNGENTTSSVSASPLKDEVRLYQKSPVNPDQGGDDKPDIPGGGDQSSGTSFKDKVSVYGSLKTATNINDLSSGKYFITVNNNGNQIYLDSSKMSLNSGKITANSPYNFNLKSGYFTIIKQNDNETYNILDENNNRYLAYDNSTNLKFEDSKNKTILSDWKLKVDPLDPSKLCFVNASDNTRALLYQTSNERFGGYAVSNFNDSTYLGVSLYKCLYSYDVLLSKLKTMDCQIMQNQSFINELISLYDSLNLEEQGALKNEYIVCNDGNTYTALYAYNYALNEINIVSPNSGINISGNQSNIIYFIVISASILTALILSICIFKRIKK